jgi:hypothetical protein
MARTFKTASLGYGFGAMNNNADTLRGFVNSNPELLAQIGGPQALDNYIKQQQGAMFHNSESGDYQMAPETQDIDKLLQGYQMNSVGAEGLENGRRKEVVKDGQTLHQGTPYSYNAAKDNLETALRGGALIAGTAGLSGLVNGAGFAGGASQTGVPFELGNMGATGTGVPFELGSMGGGGGLLSGFQSGIPAGLKQAGGKLLDMAIANPKAAGAIAGGLLGGGGGSSSGGQAYTGPMPTIERGNWQPQAQAQMMQVPSFGGGLLNTQGNAGSGLWRYGK